MKDFMRRIAWIASVVCVLSAHSVGLAQAPAEAEQPAPPTEEQTPEPVDETQALIDNLESLRERVAVLTAQMGEAQGADVQALEFQIAQTKLSFLDLISRLVDDLVEKEQAGLDVAELRLLLETVLGDLQPAIVTHIEAAQRKLSDLRRERDAADPEDFPAFETRRTRAISWIGSLFAAYVEYLDNVEKIGLDATGPREDLRFRLSSRADLIEGRVVLVTRHLSERKQQAAKNPDDTSHAAAIQLLDARLQNETRALADLVGLMDRVGLDSSRHRQLLIQSTGEVTTDVFRKGVLSGLIQSWLGEFREWLRVRGPAVAFRSIVFVLVLMAFWLLARFTRYVVSRRRSGAKVSRSQLVQNMLQYLASRVIMLVGILVALSAMGVSIGPLLAGLGIAGFIVGFALQDTLSNFAAGVMILAYQPFDVDDLIEAGGVFGRVANMSLVSTTILTFDNQTLIVPNSKIWGDVIKNTTHQDQRRVDMKFRISYSDNVALAEKTLITLLQKHPSVLDEPAPTVKLHELGEYAMELIVRPWVKTADYWPVYWDITREVKEQFDAAGISIPVREVRLEKLD